MFRHRIQLRNKRGMSSHHRLYPIRVLLRSNAVLDHGVQKWMTGRGAETVIADFPIHLVLPAQIPAERQLLEREHATLRKQLVQPGGEKNIGIEIKSSQPKNSQIAKEIVFLDPERETIENLPIFGEFVFNESNDIIVIEKSVFEIRI